MDLMIGRSINCRGLGMKDPFPTIVFCGNYSAGIFEWGSAVQVLVVFSGQGRNYDSAQKALMSKFASNVHSWFAASPGQLTDEVHGILNPESVANTRMRSVDLFMAIVDSQRRLQP